MSSSNNTKLARFVEGKDEFGCIGSENRLRQASEFGSLGYDLHELNYAQKIFFDGTHLKDKKDDKGRLAKQAQAFGLPAKIRDNPLGCGCKVAFLVGATKPVGSHIEADYMCDSGWHNYVIFELVGFEQKAEDQIKINTNGELINDSDHQTQELGGF